MKTFLLALFTISVAQADCGGYDCLDVLNMSYEEYQQKHGDPDPQAERSGYTERDIQIMRYTLMGMSDDEIERQIFIDGQSDTKRGRSD